jgi:thymidylate kinase
VSTEPVAIDEELPPAVMRQGQDAAPCACAALRACLDELGRARVRHCSWKSNDHLLAALAGETDLDLLVDADDAGTFAGVASGRGLKQVDAPPAAAYPAMQHYLGLDQESGRLFHLHLHFRLVLGQRYTKNHHLPVERQLLDSTRRLYGVPIPAADLELAILVVRALLKYRARDVVKDVLRVRSPGVPDATRAEIAWLRRDRDLEVIGAGLDAVRSVIPVDIVISFLEVVACDPRSGVEVWRLRTRLRRALRHRQRRGRLPTAATYGRALWQRRPRWLLGHQVEPRMTLPRGGTTVALIGADGAGKSTVAGELARWLGWKLEARVHYLGSKQPSPSTTWLYLGFRALRRGHRAVGSRRGEGSPATRPIAAVRDLTLALHHLAVGRDRRRRLAHARHDARAGRIVIFDRYPLAYLSDRAEHRRLDGPQIEAALGPDLSRPARLLAGAERGLYRRFGLPDHVVLLDVDPLVAIGRKPDHRLDVIRTKSRAAAELAGLAEAAGTPVTRIDADQPLDRVLLDLKARLWDVL